MNDNVPFNKPYFTGREITYIKEAFEEGKISGDGKFTIKVQELFEEEYGFLKCLLTTSCTDALEMAAILVNLKEGDEVIMPSYTFVSTANAFVLRGAKIIFCDSKKDHPGMDENLVESLITPKTKAIVPVHYAGIACDMGKIMKIANKYNLFVIEDAAHAIDSYFIGRDGVKRPIGSIGHLAAFSFHETKNVISGEGGLLVINEEKFIERAVIIRDKGTNRAKFFRGEIDKYEWLDIGSSFLPSDLIAAVLLAQFQELKKIQKRRIEIWNSFFSGLLTLQNKGQLKLPYIPDYGTNNAHIFYLVCNSQQDRKLIIEALQARKITAVFHYQSLHESKYFKRKHDNRRLPNSSIYSNRLLRLPLYYELSDANVQKIIDIILNVFNE